LFVVTGEAEAICGGIFFQPYLRASERANDERAVEANGQIKEDVYISIISSSNRIIVRLK